MKRFTLFFLLVLLFFLLLFLLSFAVKAPFEESLLQLATRGGQLGMFISIGLLISDVLLPIPSSLIMIANGAIYGMFVGSILSLLGGLGATALGYLLGKSNEKTITRFFNKHDLETGKQFFVRWGLLAIVISRPIPLLSETISVIAGTLNLGIARTLLGSIIGFLPAAIIYAYCGEFASTSDYGWKAFAVVILLGCVTWLVGKKFRKVSI